MNEAEELAYKVCRESFLSLWSYLNPRKKPFGNELCDVLVVCEPDIIIFSIKQIKLTTSGNPATDAERWRRRAVEESIKQVYGAERVVKASTHVVKKDNSFGLAFPTPPDAKIHRVAVALGGQRKVGLPFGDFGKGFVHVLDEFAFLVLLRELDTISDFVDYLSAKEEFFKSGAKTVFEGAEEDLLAFYLHQGRKFPQTYDAVVVGEGLWERFIAKDEYRRKQEADKDSYVWDKLIEEFCQSTLNNELEFSSDPTLAEHAIRVMARENRFSRRIMGKAFKEFIDQSSRIQSRYMKSFSKQLYVFLALPQDVPRKVRVAELRNRCFVVRGLHSEANRVIGLATERYQKGQGFSLDLYHLYLPTWGPKQQTALEEMQKELGYFVKPETTRDSEDEYPQT